MIRITDEDLKKGYAAGQGNESVTWHKVLERLDNGDELCLAIGYGEGFDEPTICAKIGVLAGNSAMSEYAWDFIMPYDPETGDVWDTEISIGSEGGDADWLNSQAEEVLALLNKGEYVTSGCHGKSKKEDKKKKPVKSSFEFTDSFDDQSGNWKQYKVMDEETLDKIKGYLDFKDDELQLGNVFVNVVFDSSTGELLGGQVVDTESSSWDLSAIECREIMGGMIESARKPVKSSRKIQSGNLSMKERQDWKNYQKEQEEWYSKPGIERLKARHDQKIDDKIFRVITNACAEHNMTNLPEDCEPAQYLTYDMSFDNERGICIRLHDFEGIDGSVTEAGEFDYNDTWRTMFDIFTNMLNRKNYNGNRIEAHEEGDEIWIDSPNANEILSWNNDKIWNFIMFIHDDCIANLAPKVWKQLAHKQSLMQSRKPIKSGMSYEQALADFTSMGKPWGDYWSMQYDWTMFVDSLTRDGLVDYEESRWWDNPCTPETFREWINSSTSKKRKWKHPDEVAKDNGADITCSKHLKSSKKPVKSAMQISEIHNNTSNLYARIVYSDLESDVTEFEEEELIPISDFKEQLRGYAESMNGWYTVTHRDDGYEPAEYYVTFTNGESEGNDPDSPDYDPYLENELGSIKFELVCDAGDELCSYLNS